MGRGDDFLHSTWLLRTEYPFLSYPSLRDVELRDLPRKASEISPACLWKPRASPSRNEGYAYKMANIIQGYLKRREFEDKNGGKEVGEERKKRRGREGMRKREERSN